MIQLPDGMSHRDISQWLRDGVCLLDGEPAYFRGVHDEGAVLERLDGTSQMVRYREVSRLAAVWPRCGSLNVPGAAVYLHRRQMQHYRRTYNSRCLDVVIPGKWGLVKGENASVIRHYADPMNRDVVRAAFNPEYPEWDDAIEMLDSQPLVAISPYIILSAGAVPGVYYRGRLCGRLRDDRFIPVGKGLPAARAYKLLQGRVLC